MGSHIVGLTYCTYTLGTVGSHIVGLTYCTYTLGKRHQRVQRYTAFILKTVIIVKVLRSKVMA